MGTNIALVLPVMRPGHAKHVLQDLKAQTILPETVFLVDNGRTWETFDIADSNLVQVNWCNKFTLKGWRPKENVGTNYVWNLMWSDHFEGYDYVGVIGDDYRMNERCVELMKKVIDKGVSPAVTCCIQRGTHYPCMNGDLKYKAVKGKGHLGFALFKREFLLTLPQIPKEFFIFFGDNWIGHHIENKGRQLLELNVPISHQLKYDLSEELNYKEVLESERGTWKSYIRGEIEL